MSVRITQTAIVRGGGDGGLGLLVAIVVGAVVLGPAIVAFLGLVATIVQAVIVGMCAVAGLCLVGWILKYAVGEWLDNRHSRKVQAAYWAQHDVPSVTMLAPGHGLRAIGDDATPATRQRHLADWWRL
jgi:hypothetical protein